jgi:hypothetical protein
MPRPYKIGPRKRVYSREKIETARSLIDVEKMLKLLNDNALGKVKLDAIQQRSIEISLKKALPDLSAVEMSVDQAQPFAVLPAVIEDDKAWTAAFDPSSPDPKAKH